MLFPTISFAIFFMIVMPVSWFLMPTRHRWKLFILAASYFFYGYWDWRFCVLIAGSTIANQVLATAVFRSNNERTRRIWLIVAVATNLGVLAYFKYYGFFVSNAINALNRIGIEVSTNVISVALPLGISFFTFQALSYVIDTYRGTFKPGRLIDFAVFLSFFPHIIAGPIVRPAEFIPQIDAAHDPRKIDASRAFFLITIGLFKKVVIANILATQIVDPVFSSPQQHSSLEILVGIYAYAIQIYADFSGYTDIAIGIALLLGFRFPQNFDSPYTSTSIQDFWRRWHMTLSRWLRDYLYIPLGGNQRGKWSTYRNLMLTMILGGLWHGAAWTFVIWGAIHGSFLCGEHFQRTRRLAQGLPDPVDTRARRIRGQLITFNVVCVAWVFFRAESLENAGNIFKQLLDPSQWFSASPLITLGVVLAIAAGLVEQYIPKDAWGRAMARYSHLAPVWQGLTLGICLLVINTLGPRGVAPFIYFQF